MSQQTQLGILVAPLDISRLNIHPLLPPLISQLAMYMLLTLAREIIVVVPAGTRPGVEEEPGVSVINDG